MKKLKPPREYKNSNYHYKNFKAKLNSDCGNYWTNPCRCQSMIKPIISSIAPTLHKKWSFPLRISSVNVTKSAGNCGFGHIS